MTMITSQNDAPQPRFPVPEAERIAQSIHSSLSLGEILRECNTLLAKFFPLGSLVLVQHRASETSATLYVVRDPAASVAPKVIALEPSRVQECITEQKPLYVRFDGACEQDKTEREYLLQPECTGAIYRALVFNGRLQGVLVLELCGPCELTASQNSFLDYVVRHLLLAIKNSDSHYLERRRAHQLAMISEIARQAVVLEDLNEFLQASADLVRKGFDYNYVQIWTVDQRQELILRAHAPKAAKADDPSISILPMIRECCTFNQSYRDNNVQSHADHAVHQGTCSQLVVPIRLREKFIGVLSLESGLLDAFSDQDVITMEGAASIVASAFNNLQTLMHAQQSNQYMQAILESAKDRAILSTDVHGYILTSSAGTDSVFHMSPQEVLGRDILTLFTDPGFQGELALFINQPDRPTLERSKLSQVNGNASAFLDVNLQRVYNSQKHLIGLLCMVRDVTDHVVLQHSLEALSITDDLTGLYNQRRFFSAVSDEVERCRRFNRTFALCFFDLDGFKQFNDTQGHIRGDQALKETSKILRTLLRASIDTCYRYGGDEFTIIMPETTKQKAYMVVERIRNRLSQHFATEITASIGIAEFSDSCSAEELVDKADRAMYAAKSSGGNRIIMSNE